MKKMIKVALLVMAILTAIYIAAVVYANTNSGANSYIIGYSAVRYESETPPPVWYTPEQLGIVLIIEHGNATWLQIGVDREKEPFPLSIEQPFFKHKDKFYQVAAVCIFPAEPGTTIWLNEPGTAIWLKQWQVPTGAALGVGWVFTGILFFKGRKTE